MTKQATGQTLLDLIARMAALEDDCSCGGRISTDAHHVNAEFRGERYCADGSGRIPRVPALRQYRGTGRDKAYHDNWEPVDTGTAAWVLVDHLMGKLEREFGGWRYLPLGYEYFGMPSGFEHPWEAVIHSSAKVLIIKEEIDAG